AASWDRPPAFSLLARSSGAARIASGVDSNRRSIDSSAGAPSGASVRKKDRPLDSGRSRSESPPGRLGFCVSSAACPDVRARREAAEQYGIRSRSFEAGADQRIRSTRVSESTGREVDYQDIVKGYEVEKGKFVIVTPEELESVAPEGTRTIEIEDFVALSEID